MLRSPSAWGMFVVSMFVVARSFVATCRAEVTALGRIACGPSLVSCFFRNAVFASYSSAVHGALVVQPRPGARAFKPS